jgi:hypothetical protein
MRYCLFFSALLIFICATCGSGYSESKPTKTEDHDELFKRKTNEVEILVLVEYGNMHIAVFRDKVTGLMHPLQAGNELTGGKIKNITLSAVSVHREDTTDLRYTLRNRFVKDRTSEYITYAGRDLELRGILANLARPAGIPIYVDNRVNLKLSMAVKDIHWKDLLDVLVATFGLHVMEEENAIKILREPPAEKTNHK